MNRGRVYCWTPSVGHPLGGVAAADLVELPRLFADTRGLSGLFVRVGNVGIVNMPGDRGQPVRSPVGDAEPDGDGDFVFAPGRGGGRIDKVPLADPDFRYRYLQASHFGEVNVYFHLDRIANHVDELLHSLAPLGAKRLPRVTALVNAHDGATDLDETGVRDGVRGPHRWLPFQGAHYRLSGRATAIPERRAVSADGEIHFGPGFELVDYGALVEAAGDRYRANASHNPGIIYHEYGHHVTRHTADLRANDLRPPDRQDNRKTALDEGTADYFAATMLDTPHIWAFHHRHDPESVHPRSLVSTRTMADFDSGPGANPHTNGTIWAAALWDLRQLLARGGALEARETDRLVLAALLLLGRVGAGARGARLVASLRDSFDAGLRALVEADDVLHRGAHHRAIETAFRRRGLRPDADDGAETREARC
jgi:hypothetical protein